MRQPEFGGLEVTLRADFELPVVVKPGGIHNRGANGRRFRTGRGCDIDVPLTRTMAPLAIDALGQLARIHRAISQLVMPRRSVGISVVAEHAVVGYLPPGIR